MRTSSKRRSPRIWVVSACGQSKPCQCGCVCEEATKQEFLPLAAFYARPRIRGGALDEVPEIGDSVSAGLC